MLHTGCNPPQVLLDHAQELLLVLGLDCMQHVCKAEAAEPAATAAA
jgi:hypothetical protein